jgi:hypothetical protein
MLYVGIFIALLVSFALQGDSDSKMCIGLLIFSAIFVFGGAYLSGRAEKRRRKRIKEQQLRVIYGPDPSKENQKS